MSTKAAEPKQMVCVFGLAHSALAKRLLQIHFILNAIQITTTMIMTMLTTSATFKYGPVKKLAD